MRTAKYPIWSVKPLGDVMKRVIIHAGQYKTGSTSIQKMMWSSRKALLKHGVLYPESFVRDSAHFLITDLLRQEFRDSSFSVDLQPLREELESSSANIAVISCEALSGATVRRFAPELMQYMWGRLVDLFKGFEVRVVFYVRRQDESVDSRIIQEIKGQSRKSNINHEAFLYENSSLNYYYFTQQLGKTFGADKVDVRLYDRVSLFNADVRYDFLDYLKLTNTITVNVNEDNVSPSSKLIAFFRIVNALNLDDEVYEEIRKSVWSELTASSSKAIVLGYAERRRIMEFFRPSNEKFIGECVHGDMKDRYSEVFNRKEKDVVPNVAMDGVEAMSLFKRMGLGLVKAG